MTSTLTLTSPDDMHRHLRTGEMLNTTVQHVWPFNRVLVMPNTRQVLNGADVTAHRLEIEAGCKRNNVNFTPLMSIKLTKRTTPDDIISAKKAGAVAAKYYPPDTTTDSDDGIPADAFGDREDLHKALEEAEMLLLLHGEHEKSFVMDAEIHFVKIWRKIATSFPNLRIVVEHLSTMVGAMAVENAGPNVAATITPHHLILTLDDVVKKVVRPHNACMPVVKRPEDRDYLRYVISTGNYKFFAGTDDAPHLKEHKESDECRCGVFMGKWGMLWYAQVFEQALILARLDNFASKFGAEFYGLPRNQDRLELFKKPTTIPKIVDGIVPFMAGKEVSWSYA